MTFLNPAALWGLLALLVPIIVHFFNLQRPRQVLFSNVAFVKEVKRTVVKRLNFQRWLLLLLRLLAIAAIVLMFANPVKLTSNQTMLQGSRSVAFVIDNSLSMESSNERGEYFRQAISLTRNLINAYTQEDEFLITSASDLSPQAGFVGKDDVLDHLEKLRIEQNTRSLANMLAITPGLFQRSGGAIRELYILSDFQQSTVLKDSMESSISDSSLRVHLIPIASRQPANVYVTDHEISSRVMASDRPVGLNFTLVNDGDAPVQNLNVRAVLEGKVVAISNHNLEGNERKNITLTFNPGTTGWLNGHIELDDQPVDFDNKRFFSFYVPGKERLLLVESAPAPNLSVLFEEVFDQFDVTILNDRRLANVSFSDYQGIIWAGANSFSSGLTNQLSQFIGNGGNLMLFPGSEINVASWNEFLNTLNIGQLDDEIRVEEGIEARTFDLQHPVFDGVFSSSKANAKPDPIRVFQYYPINLSGAVAQSKIIQLENSLPFMVESRFEEGTTILFPVFPGNKWSDFQVKAVFAPLMFRSAQLMSQSGRISLDQEIGQYTPLVVKASSQESISLRNADGEIFTPERYDRAGETHLVFERMKLDAGNYSIIQADTVLAAVSFNVTDEESALAFADESMLRENLENEGLEDQVDILPRSSEVLALEIEQSREGWPLWRWFLWAAIIFLLAEVLILGAGRRISL